MLYWTYQTLKGVKNMKENRNKTLIIVLLLLAVLLAALLCFWFLNKGSQDEGQQETPHVCAPAAAVIENKVEATCETAGSYDEVVYCGVCGEELSRESKTIAALGHKPSAAVIEN